MNGDVIIHSVEVKEYVRVLPNGKRVVVKGYRRQGNAAQDDLNRRIEDSTRTLNRMVRSSQKKYEVAKNKFRAENGREPGLNDLHKEYNELNSYRQERDKAIRKEKSKKPTVQEAIQFAATDAYETVQVAVGNALEDLKARHTYAADVMSGMAKEVVDTVRSGWDAVKNFFGGLFGRKR